MGHILKKYPWLWVVIIVFVFVGGCLEYFEII